MNKNLQAIEKNKMSSSTKNFLTSNESEGERLISQKVFIKKIASRITKKLCRRGKVHTYFKC